MVFSPVRFQKVFNNLQLSPSILTCSKLRWRLIYTINIKRGEHSGETKIYFLWLPLKYKMSLESEFSGYILERFWRCGIFVHFIYIWSIFTPRSVSENRKSHLFAPPLFLSYRALLLYLTYQNKGANLIRLWEQQHNLSIKRMCAIPAAWHFRFKGGDLQKFALLNTLYFCLKQIQTRRNGS